MLFQSFFLCILVILLAGCQTFHTDWIPFYKKAEIAQPVLIQSQPVPVEQKANAYVDSGRVIDAETLKKGGTIYIIPFRAGPNVEANERLDELSLKMIQGISDELDGYRPYFKIITDQGKEEGDFTLKGFFLEITKPSMLQKWWPGPDQKMVHLKGQMILNASDKLILIFEDTHVSNDEKKDSLTISYELGQDIGRFIRSGARE